MSHNDFTPEYEETVIAQIGVKMLDFKDSLDFPMYLRMFDIPGNAVSHVKDEESIYKNLDYVFITLDGSKVIHKEHVQALNTFVIQRLRAYNEKVIAKENRDIKYKEYLFRLMGLELDDDESGNVINHDDENHFKQMNDHHDEEEDERHNEYLNNDASQHMNSEVNNMNSQYTIMNVRNETYKSQHSPREPENHKENLDEIMNIYKKKHKTYTA